MTAESSQSVGTPKRRRIVVGVSDSPAGRAAVQLALKAAAEHHAALDLVRVWRDIGWFFSMTIADVQALPDSERADEKILHDAVNAAHSADPAVEVIEDFARGDLYSDLLERTTDAQLLVLGADTEDLASGAGSIDEWFQHHAHCPVVVVAADGHVLSGGTDLPVSSAAT